jgi:hypothetical protein
MDFQLGRSVVGKDLVELSSTRLDTMRIQLG